ncbi:MAG: cell envelope integrity protein TolA [Gammaproteobacteria bacterium]|nr:cell envelope integrity protein TolA [Gammaproteobacteria bacterium]
MIRDTKNIIPVSLAVLLHAVLLTSMIVAFDYARPQPFTPLAVQATLVTEVPEISAPVIEPEPEPVIEEPEPEPEPVVEEPEPEPEPVIEEPEPDDSEQLRLQAEEEKRRLDALVEQERLEKLRLQEEAEQKRKSAEEAERKRREEEDKERKRLEAERQREEDIRRQREENERLRRELEDEARAEEIAAEENRLAAVDAGALALYTAQIRQKIERNWSAPASAGAELRCSVRVRQLRGGEVVGVTILNCNGDDAVRRSVEAAIYRSSPLPEPSDPNLFDRNILLNLSIRQ